MAKDPAFLFYTSDFLTGTLTMTDEQVGKYIRLLCLQHQKGSLSEKDMLFICKSYDEDIFCKFVKIESGYYNQRLKDESEKRSKYSESRANNRKSKKDMLNISKTYVSHMENENENENISKGVVGEIFDPQSFEKQLFYNLESMKESNHWDELKEYVYRKTHKSPTRDKFFVGDVVVKYDLHLEEKRLWQLGLTPKQFAAGVAKWVMNEEKFNK
jgi:hypothetical protein